MKIILSRKGFDSSSGGCPSPVLPDGKAFALPIPDEKSIIKYSEINYKNYNVGKIVSELTKNKVKENDFAHLDPDLDENVFPRKNGWRPIFGQCEASQGHLENQNVGVGDIFLFFGLFRKTVEQNGMLVWEQGSKPFHAFWGWMQIGNIFPVADSLRNEISWVEYHPHFQYKNVKNNCLYISSDELKINGEKICSKGAGTFSTLKAEHILTRAEAANVTDWRLPLWLYPEVGKTPLSYHSDLSRWHKNKENCFLKLVARGQEFVFDSKEYLESIEWVKELIRGEAHKNSGA